MAANPNEWLQPCVVAKAFHKETRTFLNPLLRRMPVLVHQRKSNTGHVVLTVADNGPGMTAAHRAEAFTRYGGEAAAGRSGLGLAIVSRLVTADHGRIDLDETAGGGLSVVVRLPAA